MWLSGDYKDLPTLRQAITDIGFRHSPDRVLLIDGRMYSWFHPCSEEQSNSPTTKPEEASTELYRAVSDGDFELTKLTLKQGADPNCSNWPGVTPLLVAARAQRNDLIKLLMENGADPAISFDNRMDTQSMSAFELSLHLGNSEGAAIINGQNIVDLHPEWPGAWKSLPVKDRRVQPLLTSASDSTSTSLLRFITSSRIPIALRPLQATTPRCLQRRGNIRLFCCRIRVSSLFESWNSL